MRASWNRKRRGTIKRLAAAAVPALAAVIMGLGTAPAYAGGPLAGQLRPIRAEAPAQSTPGEWCGNGGTGYCLNDWNGTIGEVKMYYGGYSNDHFYTESLGLCAGDRVTDGPSYCPFGDHTLDGDFKGDPIIQLDSAVNFNWCIGSTTTSSLTILQPCNTISNGSGGGTGTVLVEVSCAPGDVYLVDRYWASRYSTKEYLESGNAIGNQANQDYSGSSPTCWG